MNNIRWNTNSKSQFNCVIYEEVKCRIVFTEIESVVESFVIHTQIMIIINMRILFFFLLLSFSLSFFSLFLSFLFFISCLSLSISFRPKLNTILTKPKTKFSPETVIIYVHSHRYLNCIAWIISKFNATENHFPLAKQCQTYTQHKCVCMCVLAKCVIVKEWEREENTSRSII